MEEYKGKLAVFAGIDEVRFKRKVIPGDVLKLEVEIITLKRNIGKAKATAYVNDKVACKGVLMFGITENE